MPPRRRGRPPSGRSSPEPHLNMLKAIHEVGVHKDRILRHLHIEPRRKISSSSSTISSLAKEAPKQK